MCSSKMRVIKFIDELFTFQLWKMYPQKTDIHPVEMFILYYVTQNNIDLLNAKDFFVFTNIQ